MAITNPYQVSVAPLDFYDGDFAKVTKSYHGISILNNAGSEVGRISDWSYNVFTRDVFHVRELGRFSFGRYVDAVPGPSTASYSITVTRAELWGNEFELAMGETQAYEDLVDQVAPFRLVEVLYRGNSEYEQHEYVGCWWREKNIQGYTADGNAVVQVNGEIAFVNRSRLS